MLFELTHETTFAYSEPVAETYMEFRLTPLTDSGQRLLQHRQRVVPLRQVRQYVDARGNAVSYFNLTALEERIEISFDSLVETYPAAFRGTGLPDGADASPATAMLLYDYLGPTPLTPWDEAFFAFAHPFERLRGRHAAEVADTLCAAIHSQFRYEGELTDASSPITELLRHGAGVCQDFAHLMLATCRTLGFAARYVSGYLCREAEQSASHAWVEVFDPTRGWFGIDPTHNCRVDEWYMRLGVGRDFQDVPTNRGVFRGHASEEVSIRVQVRPIDLSELESRTWSLYPRAEGNIAGSRRSRKPPPVSILQQTASVQQQQQQQ